MVKTLFRNYNKLYSKTLLIQIAWDGINNAMNF